MHQLLGHAVNITPSGASIPLRAIIQLFSLQVTMRRGTNSIKWAGTATPNLFDRHDRVTSSGLAVSISVPSFYDILFGASKDSVIYHLESTPVIFESWLSESILTASSQRLFTFCLTVLSDFEYDNNGEWITTNKARARVLSIMRGIARKYATLVRQYFVGKSISLLMCQWASCVLCCESQEKASGRWLILRSRGQVYYRYPFFHHLIVSYLLFTGICWTHQVEAHDMPIIWSLGG